MLALALPSPPPGLTFFDPLCGLFVTFIIFRMGLSIAKQTLHELTDGSVPQSVLSRIEEVAMQVKAVEKVEDIRARRMGRYVVSSLLSSLIFISNFFDSNANTQASIGRKECGYIYMCGSGVRYECLHQGRKHTVGSTEHFRCY